MAAARSYSIRMLLAPLQLLSNLAPPIILRSKKNAGKGTARAVSLPRFRWLYQSPCPAPVPPG